jgi:hypothetical protein
MNATYFDIETGPLPDEQLASMIPPFDPAEVKTGNLKDPDKISAKLQQAETNHFADARDKAALDAITGRVLAIGLEDADGFRAITGDEATMLDTFWNGFACAESHYIGFNICLFDLPFLIKRSWHNCVKVPVSARSGRWWSDRFIDLRDTWQLGDRKAKGSLDAICKHLWIEGKNGNGKDFARLFELNPEKALEYLSNDLRMTRQVHERLAGLEAMA